MMNASLKRWITDTSDSLTKLTVVLKCTKIVCIYGKIQGT